jgi:hypothetical protein
MEAVSSSTTSINTYRITRHQKDEDGGGMFLRTDGNHLEGYKVFEIEDGREMFQYNVCNHFQGCTRLKMKMKAVSSFTTSVTTYKCTRCQSEDRQGKILHSF